MLVAEEGSCILEEDKKEAEEDEEDTNEEEEDGATEGSALLVNLVVSSPVDLPFGPDSPPDHHGLSLLLTEGSS